MTTLTVTVPWTSFIRVVKNLDTVEALALIRAAFNCSLHHAKHILIDIKETT